MALAKVISITLFGVLGAIVTFMGLILSLPNMMQGMGDADFNGFSITAYAWLLVITISTVLVFVAVFSVISAYAKSIKQATSLASPFMMLGMIIGFSNMFTGGAMAEFYYYLIPIFNSAQSLSAIINNDISLVNIVVATLSNVIFSLILVGVLAKMFSSEKIVFDK
jgi:sodium transport system permease protein